MTNDDLRDIETLATYSLCQVRIVISFPGRRQIQIRLE